MDWLNAWIQNWGPAWLVGGAALGWWGPKLRRARNERVDHLDPPLGVCLEDPDGEVLPLRTHYRGRNLMGLGWRRTWQVYLPDPVNAGVVMGHFKLHADKLPARTRLLVRVVTLSEFTTWRQEIEERRRQEGTDGSAG